MSLLLEPIYNQVAFDLNFITNNDSLNENKIFTSNMNIQQVVYNALVSNTLEDPDHFIIVNLADIIYQYNHWKEKLPTIIPYYAIKSNSNPVIIKLLHTLGCGFDVASMKEIQTVLSCGIEPYKMVYANPCKSIKYIEFAKEVGVNLLVVDCICELEKMALHYPNADLLIRIKGDDSYSLCKFNTKYGLEGKELVGIFKKAVELGSCIKGVSFHIGSSCKNKNVFKDVIRKCKYVFDTGNSYGFNMNILDIGGGFLGDIDNVLFDDVAEVINEAINTNFTKTEVESMRIIAEPGRYFCSASHTLVTSVICTKTRVNGKTGEITMVYYISDGVYGIFSGALFDYATFEIEVFNPDHPDKVEKNEPVYYSIIFGPTCDSLDIINKGCMLPLLEVGDKLIIRNIGAYSIESATEFNGFPIPEKYYIM